MHTQYNVLSTKSPKFWDDVLDNSEEEKSFLVQHGDRLLDVVSFPGDELRLVDWLPDETGVKCTLSLPAPQWVQEDVFA